MENMLTRRTIAAAIPIAAFSAAPAAAASATRTLNHPDADLLAMAELALAAKARKIEFYRQADSVFEDIDFAHIPDVLRWLPSDSPLVCSSPKRCAAYRFADDVTHHYAYDNGIKDLSRFANDFAAQGDAYQNYFFGEKARARTCEIMEAHAAWQADHRRAEDAAGYTAPVQAAEREQETITLLQRRMVAMPARTADGIRAKARVANLNLSEDPTWAERAHLPKLIRDMAHDPSGGDLFDLLSMSLLVDALKLDAAHIPSNERSAA